MNRLLAAGEALVDRPQRVPLPEVGPPSDPASQVGGPGAQRDVTVNGRPAQLVRQDQGTVDDGTTCVVQAPESFTEEQVRRVAESVTYHP